MLTNTTALQEAVKEIVRSTNNNSFMVTASIRNYEDPDFVIDDFKLNTIIITSNYSNSVADDLQCSITVDLPNLLKICKKLTSVYMSIITETLDSAGVIDLTVPPDIYEFRVLFHDYENIAKKYNITSLINLDPADPTIVNYGERFTFIDINLQLITDTAYHLTKQAIQVVSSNVKMGTIVKYVASKMGATKFNITPPDNTVSYNRVNVPVQHTKFDTIFDYLQHRYGIYSNGLAFYFAQDGIFYMYPKFDVTPDREDILRIYKVNPNSYAGMENKWMKEGDVISLICDSETKHVPVAAKLVENKGSTKIFASADKVIDGQVTMGTDGSATMKDIHYSFTSDVNQGIADNVAAPDYKGDTLNQFEMASELSEANTELLIMHWDFCPMFITNPGMRVEYVYDEADGPKMLTGTIDSVSTEVLRGSNQNGIHKYTANSSVVLRLTTDAVTFHLS